MAFKHPKLAQALSWKFKDQSGMSTRDGELIKFPGPMPTDAQLAKIVQDFEALPDDDMAKDRKKGIKKRLKNATLAEMRKIVEDLV